MVFAERLDIAPNDMETMTAQIEPLPSLDAGIYRFRASLLLPGRYRLSIAAKVQGEIGSLENRLELEVTP